MEDPRISRMYAAMIGRAVSRSGARFMSGAWLRSSVTWIILIVVILISVGVAIHEKGKGQLTKLKTQLGAPVPVAVMAPPQPGGQDPVTLGRAQATGAIMPEFLSATLLPGRGMNVLQIMAYLPGRGEVPLLAAPAVADAAKAMTGVEGDVNGEASLLGGPFEVPWAGRFAGSALPGGLAVLANWHGRGLTVPVISAQPAGNESNSSIGGLLLKSAAAGNVGTTVMPDGGVAQATFHAEDFDGHWPSKTDITTTVLLSARRMDLTVVAKNVGTEPEPMGLGWRPRFAFAEGDRAQVTLRVPSSARLEVNEGKSGLPTGRVLPVEGTAYDFSGRNGVALKTLSLDTSFVSLKNGLLSSGPEVELRDPAAGYGIRMTALTSSIKALHVYAPAGESMMVIDPQTNYDDPFGREWAKTEDTGLVVLQPGESLQWKIRMELFQVTGESMGAH